MTSKGDISDPRIEAAEPPDPDTSIPLSVLFGRPHHDQVQISPNGRYLAWRSRGREDPHEKKQDVLNIFAKHLETSVTRQLTFYDDMDACVYFVFTSDDRSIVFLRETKRGSENYHLYAVDIDSFFSQDDNSQADDNSKSSLHPKPRSLIQNDDMTCGIGFVGGVQLWTSPISPRCVYASTSRIGPYSMFWDVSWINIDTREIVLVERNDMSSRWGMMRLILLALIARILSYCRIKIKPPGVPIQWFPDDNMIFRGRIEVNLLNLGVSFCARSKNGGWKTIHSCSFEETNLQLVGSMGGSGTARMEFDDDAVDIHICAYKTNGKASDTTTYDRFNIKTGQYVRRVAGSNAKSDITGFGTDPKGRARFVYYEWEKSTLEIIPGSGDDLSLLEEDILFIRSFFQPSMMFRIVSCTNSDDTWVLFAQNDVGHSMFQGGPSAFFLFTRTTTNKGSTTIKRNIEIIQPSRPEMSKYNLARVYPFHIKAADGEEIMCYLTSKPEIPAVKGHKPTPPIPPPPLVVVVHGGPQARDSWGYNPLCQFLCSRGFRVIQVNYRGSTGFGARFLRAGMSGQFYKALQTDIVDAVKYATSASATDNTDSEVVVPPRPWGDPKQLAILGASFGGYSALWQMTSNPGLFKCAVVICPISSVGAADEDSRNAFGGSPLIAKYWHGVFGKDVSTMRDVAIEASPMYHIHRVARGSKIALYHGENDRRAPIQHSYNMMRELQKWGIAGEFVSFRGEGHGLSKVANSLYVYHRIQTFLCKEFSMNTFVTVDDEKLFEQNTGRVEWS